mmetsp:Transcript_9474/g.18627  ORF Transcript_9474/g.18627 Transcript_9474/m.18627 type:complete len:208 (-) Transcript_9474:138-761(-)
MVAHALEKGAGGFNRVCDGKTPQPNRRPPHRRQVKEQGHHRHRELIPATAATATSAATAPTARRGGRGGALGVEKREHEQHGVEREAGPKHARLPRPRHAPSHAHRVCRRRAHQFHTLPLHPKRANKRAHTRRRSRRSSRLLLRTTLSTCAATRLAVVMLADGHGRRVCRGQDEAPSQRRKLEKRGQVKHHVEGQDPQGKVRVGHHA